MKISYNWIKEYIDIKQSPEKLAALLTKSGSEVKAVEKIDGDYLMDIEVTPNRSDCLSYIGIAREVSALTGKTVKMPPLKAKGQKSKAKAGFAVEIKDRDLCPRYTARLIQNVKVGESPEWLKKKITAMGLRPVNSIVDITNFVLFELGQPMHAFDYDKIKGGAVIIRRARAGESIISIDKVKRRLEKDTLVIADRERPIAIGGVMGGLDTEVTENTKNVLLESAYFNPVSVRRASFRLALISESSYRFERGVDPGMVLGASDRAALLIKDICGGVIAELVDKGEKKTKEQKINLRVAQLNQILNLKLKEGYVKKALSKLGLKATPSKKGAFKVSVPTFRQDVRYEVDLIEEIARLYGYENIATTIPRAIPNPERKPKAWIVKEKTKDILASLGLREVITCGLLGKAALPRAFFGDSIGTITVKNPLSAEQELMRPSLIPGILNALSYNINRGIRDIKIFEIGGAYQRNRDGRYEDTNLCIALTGIFSSDWQRPKGPVTIFDLKGIIDMLFSQLGLEIERLTMGPGRLTPEYKKWIEGRLEEGKKLKLIYDGTDLGFIGSVTPGASDAFDLKQGAFITEINLRVLEEYINLAKRFSDIPKYPSIKRDISLIAGKGVSFGKIKSLIEEQGGELVESVELFDRYTGKHIPHGHHGLSFRIEYRDRKKTLTAVEVDKIHSEIRKSLVEALGVTLR